MMFRVGQKVACVDNSPWVNPLSADDALLTLNAVYTITQAGLPPFCKVYSVKVAELHPTKWLRADRFRPLVERKTDISLFQKMLNPSVQQLRELIRESDAC